MKTIKQLLPVFLLAIAAVSCETLFGSKEDGITDEIFDQGRLDPNVIVDEVGYAALTPFWEGFDSPTSVAVGFDEMIYVTDAHGVHVLDRAGRRFKTYALRGATAVTQDRNLNLFVAARVDVRIDTLLKNPQVTDTTVWDLACVYVLHDLNRDTTTSVLDLLIHPFMDASRVNTSSRIARLQKGSQVSDELVQLTGIGVLADNTVYITRRGPVNTGTGISAPDNTVLEFSRESNGSGGFIDQWINARVLTALSATVPSLISGVGISAIATFIAPPQRERFSPDRGFLVAQADTTLQIPYRVLWISAIETPDGLSFEPNAALLTQDTSKAGRFLYETDRFATPSGLAYAADGTGYIFVTDEGRDSLYIFQTNGFEGVRRPGAPSGAKPAIASFGGFGTGPRQFKNPSGVAYFRRVVYVADAGNNRIARYKLNTDFE